MLFGKLERERRECASLTKIMTAFVVLRLMEKFNIDESTLITIGTDATTTIG
ncbi:MAG: hypothetical protein ACK5NI_02350, partial [bacterium]